MVRPPFFTFPLLSDLMQEVQDEEDEEDDYGDEDCREVECYYFFKILSPEKLVKYISITFFFLQKKHRMMTKMVMMQRVQMEMNLMVRTALELLEQLRVVEADKATQVVEAEVEARRIRNFSTDGRYLFQATSLGFS